MVTGAPNALKEELLGETLRFLGSPWLSAAWVIEEWSSGLLLNPLC